MKKILALLLLFLVPTLVPAQTIHWLTFIDTTDNRPDGVGEIDKNVRKVLYDRIVNIVNAAVREKGYSANILDVYGAVHSPQKCKELVMSLAPKPDDIIVFYYVGHGTHGAPGGEPWPMMCMAQDNPSLFIPLKWVHDQLKSKNARLTVTIGMCCNDFADIPRLSSPTFSTNYGSPSLSEREIIGLQKLFLNYRGDVLITSASPGESSGCVGTPLGGMDTFTWCFFNELKNNSNDSNPTWQEFTDDLKASVTYTSHTYSRTHHTPVTAVNVSSASAPAKKPQTPVSVNQPQSQQTAVSEDQKMINQLGVALDIALNRDLSRSERGSQIDKINEIFTSDAEVKIMSQDGAFILDCIPASSYFRRLIINESLIKVAPTEIHKKGSRISGLKVKETYKE